MPYKIVIEYEDGRTNETGPICCDNPASDFGLEDKKIKRKCDFWAAKFQKDDDVKESYTIHYMEHSA